ncbi:MULTISPECIES: PLD nuclease N-terminal domain-containing protein [Carnobacterium]|uniref:Phospholipase_D-nuclease N-terminal n=1 Tax=Carnobacterium alterfunditum TaxID=28230 RepID=A0A1N6ERJ8_9LACT|nr:MULTISPECIES: PLD nuclease N-terminal domain-containing protein [Carnobacterium]MBT2732268.1 PLDc_N domain-containing protein [Carnobacterium sp. ISL-102]SIN85645.1 Phospholipase_D-nuclease N-terminal [Carnobacterium alterfunditum]
MNTNIDLLIEYLPFIAPLILLQIGLAIFSAVHVVRHPHYRFGNRMMWLLVVLLIQWIGPLVYFVFGRGDEHDR